MPKNHNVHYLYDKHAAVELIICDQSTLSYPLHNHVSAFTIGMVLDGSIKLTANHGSPIYTRNQTFVIMPYVPHSIEAKNRYTLLSLCINKHAVNAMELDKLKTAILALLNMASDFAKINHEQRVQLLSCLNSLKDSSLEYTNTAEPYIEKLKQQLKLFPERKFSVEEMAQTTFISKYYFIRSFKKGIGLTPHQFQLQNRVRKAQRLLNQGGTITEVALTAGFCDQNHFIKQFEKIVRLTPMAYQMSFRVFKSNSTG